MGPEASVVGTIVPHFLFDPFGRSDRRAFTSAWRCGHHGLQWSGHETNQIVDTGLVQAIVDIHTERDAVAIERSAYGESTVSLQYGVGIVQAVRAGEIIATGK